MKTLIILLCLLLPFNLKTVEHTYRKTSIDVVATCYNATIAQCDKDPLTTAFGYKINKKHASNHKYIAISRDLEKYFNTGDTVFVEGTFIYDGYWIIADRMNKRFTNRIDFLVKQNDFIGKFDNVTITKK